MGGQGYTVKINCVTFSATADTPEDNERALAAMNKLMDGASDVRGYGRYVLDHTSGEWVKADKENPPGAYGNR